MTWAGQGEADVTGREREKDLWGLGWDKERNQARLSGILFGSLEEKSRIGTTRLGSSQAWTQVPAQLLKALGRYSTCVNLSVPICKMGRDRAQLP